MRIVSGRTEETANAVTHGVGAIGGVVALAVLVTLASRGGDAREIVSVSLFGVTLILLYLASAIYHATRDPVIKARLKVLDHSAIYLLIAGTYTPFALGVLRGAWGWSLFGVIWGLAAAGVTFKLYFTGRFKLASTLIYIGMGWLGLVAAVPLVSNMGVASLIWLVAGGLAYTVGTPFYQAGRFRYAHTVWHGFVLVGSTCHVVAVALQL